MTLQFTEGGGEIACRCALADTPDTTLSTRNGTRVYRGEPQEPFPPGRLFVVWSMGHNVGLGNPSEYIARKMIP